MIDGKNIRPWIISIGVVIAVVVLSSFFGAPSFKPFPPGAHTVQAQNRSQKLLDDTAKEHPKETRNALNTRSMPFWGSTYVGSNDLRADLRSINEIVRREALDWILDQGTSIKVTDMTSNWNRSPNLVNFVITIYYNEEKK